VSDKSACMTYSS